MPNTFSLLCLSGVFVAFSLDGRFTDSTNTIKSPNAFYFALGGKGNNRSINFEHVFRTGHSMNYSYSAGFSKNGSEYGVPLSLNAFTAGKQHHLEFSLGSIPYVAKHITSKGIDSDKQMYIRPAMGYRYQKTITGWFVKAGIGPQLFLDPASSNFWNMQPRILAPSAQLAVGVSF